MSQLLDNQPQQDQEQQAVGITKVASTQVDAVIRQDAKVVKAKVEKYVKFRDKFVKDALGLTTLEAEDVDAPFDYSGLFS